MPPGGPGECEVYDGEGNRVSETAGGVTTKYLVDTLNPTHLPQVLDETVNGSVTRTYAHRLQRVSENQLVGSTWTPRFYGYDGHDNVRLAWLVRRCSRLERKRTLVTVWTEV